MQYGFLNGKIVPVNKIKVSSRDAGFLRAYGCFEVMRAYGGKLFKAREYLGRLRQSARVIGIRFPYSVEHLERAIRILIRKNRLSEAGIRIVVTAGPSQSAFAFNGATVIMLADVYRPYPELWYARGVRLATVPYARDLPELKTLNYAVPMMLLKRVRHRGAIEALYVSGGNILETNFSNFFLFKGATLVTPARGMFPGTIRTTVLGLARRLGFKVRVRTVRISELRSATEAFITSSVKDVMPVVRVDGRAIGNGRVGEHTKRLMAAFERAVRIRSR
jgi:D-alanine transaminase/branched-chain amino acid aminotransferase